MKIAVTGAAGFMGRSLVARLSGLPGVTVTGLDRVQAPTGLSARWIQGDLADDADLADLVAGQDVIYHLAHTNTPLTSDQDFVEDASLNLIPTLKLIRSIEKLGTKPHLVFPSSGGAVYGTSPAHHRFSEEDPCRPLNSYGIQKLVAEHYIRIASGRGILSATILRISNAYGWLLPADRPQGFIGTAATRVLSGQPIRILGSPDNVRDYVHIDDVLAALVLPLSGHGEFDLYNVGTGVGTSVAEIAEMIQQTVARPVDRQEVPARFAPLLPNWCVLNPEKIQRERGWKSTLTLQEGIRRLLVQGP